MKILIEQVLNHLGKRKTKKSKKKGTASQSVGRSFKHSLEDWTYKATFQGTTSIFGHTFEHKKQGSAVQTWESKYQSWLNESLGQWASLSTIRKFKSQVGILRSSVRWTLGQRRTCIGHPNIYTTKLLILDWTIVSNASITNRNVIVSTASFSCIKCLIIRGHFGPIFGVL